jgi:hypothetical protein
MGVESVVERRVSDGARPLSTNERRASSAARQCKCRMWIIARRELNIARRELRIARPVSLVERRVSSVKRGAYTLERCASSVVRRVSSSVAARRPSSGEHAGFERQACGFRATIVKRRLSRVEL